MHGAAEQGRAFQNLFERFSSEMTAKHRDALNKYIDLLKDLTEQHHKYINEEGSRTEDPFSTFAKMLMASYMRMLAFHKENRSFFLSAQASLVEMQLCWLDLMKETLHREPSDAGKI
jgi:hypothetical protein